MPEDRFPIPVNGQEIPRGWFARFVRFVNSLIPRGDGRYVMVDRTDAGATITLSPALINRLAGGGSPGTPGAPGGATGIQAAVSGGSASVTLTGGTGSAVFAPGSGVTISGGSHGEVVISATGGSFPDYAAPLEYILSPDTVYQFQTPVWLFGYIELNPVDVYGANALVSIAVPPSTTPLTIIYWASSTSSTDTMRYPVSLPIPANVRFKISGSNLTSAISAYSTLS